MKATCLNKACAPKEHAVMNWKPLEPWETAAVLTYSDNIYYESSFVFFKKKSNFSSELNFSAELSGFVYLFLLYLSSLHLLSVLSSKDNCMQYTSHLSYFWSWKEVVFLVLLIVRNYLLISKPYFQTPDLCFNCLAHKLIHLNLHDFFYPPLSFSRFWASTTFLGVILHPDLMSECGLILIRVEDS